MNIDLSSSSDWVRAVKACRGQGRRAFLAPAPDEAQSWALPDVFNIVLGLLRLHADMPDFKEWIVLSPNCACADEATASLYAFVAKQVTE